MKLKASTVALTEWTGLLVAAVTAGADARAAVRMQESNERLRRVLNEDHARDMAELRTFLSGGGRVGLDDPRSPLVEPTSNERSSFEANLRTELVSLGCNASAAHAATEAEWARAVARHGEVISLLGSLSARLEGAHAKLDATHDVASATLNAVLAQGM